MNRRDIKVLVCDDDSAFREALIFDLEEEGFTVIASKDGRTGFDLMAKERPKVIISDYLMPDGDGLEFLERIRRLNLEQPTVIITTGSLDVSIEKAIDQGAEAVFFKPFVVSNLIDVIRRSLLPFEEKWTSNRINTRMDVKSNIAIRIGEYSQAASAGLINIGRGGLFLAIPGDQKLPKTNELISFQILLSETAKIEGTGRVRWIRHIEENGMPRGCGIEFETLNAESHRLVIGLINDLKTKKFVPRA